MKSLTLVAVVVVALASQLAMACDGSKEPNVSKYDNPKGQGVSLTSYTSVRPTYTATSQTGAGADANQYAAPVVHKQKARTSTENGE